MYIHKQDVIKMFTNPNYNVSAYTCIYTCFMNTFAAISRIVRLLHM